MTWHAFFDESGTSAADHWLVVAGYLFDDRNRLELDGKWRSMLADSIDAKGNSLPYFHMGDCAHNTKVFRHFTRIQCDQIARRAIASIVEHMEFGFAVSIDKRLASSIPTDGLFSSPYSFACWQCLMSVRRWADERKYSGDVVYYFENGHESRAEADRLMKEIFSEPTLRKAYRVVQHGFHNKGEVRLLQCADILAWQWFIQAKKMEALGIKDPRNCAVPVRKEFAALILQKQERYVMQIFDAMQIRSLANFHALQKFKRNWRSVISMGDELIFDLLKNIGSGRNQS